MSRALALAALIGCAHPQPAPLASRFGPVPAHVGDLVVDDAAFATFAARVRADAEARGDRDRDGLFVRAMLEALAGRWDAAVGLLDRLRAAEPDPHAALVTGMSIRMVAYARAHGGDLGAAITAVLGDDLVPVRADLAQLRAMAETFTPAVCRGLVEDAVGPHARALTFADAQTIVFQRYAAVVLAPVGQQLDAALAARGIGLPAAEP